MRGSVYLIALAFFSACAAAPSAKDLPLASEIVVHKGARVMYLLDEYGQPIKSYKISLGGNPAGPKQCEGDLKTPEGSYFIEARNPDSKYHLSLKLSYPNEEDVARAEAMGLSPGGDIFIHGAPNDAAFGGFLYGFKPTWTEGCIAVGNRDIEEIWAMIPDGAPVTITP